MMDQLKEEICAVCRADETAEWAIPPDFCERMDLVLSALGAMPEIRARGPVLALRESGQWRAANLAGETMVGSAAACDLRLDSRLVSRRHARIREDDNGWVVEDLGSTNGLFVNGARVEGADLHDGDLLQLGDTVAVFFGPPEALD